MRFSDAPSATAQSQPLRRRRPSALPWAAAAAALWLAGPSVHAEAVECEGAVAFAGLGPARLRDSSGFSRIRARALAHEGVEVYLEGSARFESGCEGDKIFALNLLGKKLSYVVDLSSAGCGCSAKLNLMGIDTRTGTPCSAADGDPGCASITIQDANLHMFFSSFLVHPGSNSDGSPSAGVGAGAEILNATTYGPGAPFVDSALPFKVEVLFPVDHAGLLQRVEIRIYQGGLLCASMNLEGTYPALLGALSKALEGGMTPMISYSATVEGSGPSGVTGCEAVGLKNTMEACGEAIHFAEFQVSWLVMPSQVADASVAAPLAPPPFYDAPTKPPQPPPTPAQEQVPERESEGDRKEDKPIQHPCIKGWRADPECSPQFLHNGQTYIGCTDFEIDQMWCSVDMVFFGHRKLCEPCGQATLQERAIDGIAKAIRTVEKEGPSSSKQQTDEMHPHQHRPDANKESLKPCIAGWEQHPRCVSKFMYRGEIIEGCTDWDYRQAWCSPNHTFSGERLMCNGCGPMGRAAAGPGSDTSDGTSSTAPARTPQEVLPGMPAPEPTVTVKPVDAGQNAIHAAAAMVYAFAAQEKDKREVMSLAENEQNHRGGGIRGGAGPSQRMKTIFEMAPIVLAAWLLVAVVFVIPIAWVCREVAQARSDPFYHISGQGLLSTLSAGGGNTPARVAGSAPEDIDDEEAGTEIVE